MKPLSDYHLNPPEPTRAEREFEIAMDDMTAEEFVALLERHERIRELAWEAVIAGRNCPTNAAGLAAMTYTAVEEQVRADIIADDANEAALARHLARTEA